MKKADWWLPWQEGRGEEEQEERNFKGTQGKLLNVMSTLIMLTVMIVLHI